MDLLGRSNKPQVARPPNIVVHVPLDQPSVNFNFAALAEAKYGWDALHPIEARIRAINRYESEEESDSEAPAIENAHPGTNGAVNGQNTENGHTSADAQPPKKKRKKRRDLEYYDINDPFIDDDELELQERTVASKDGFFVFQGPLVAEGEKVRIEKADGTQRRTGGKGSRGGRGRGGGRAAASTGPGRASSRTKAQETKSDDDEASVVVSSSVKTKTTKKSTAATSPEATTEVAKEMGTLANAPDDLSQRSSKVPALNDSTQDIVSVRGLDKPSPAMAVDHPMRSATTSPVAEKVKRTTKIKGSTGGTADSPDTMGVNATPDAKIPKKRAPSAATLAKRAEKAAAAAANADHGTNKIVPEKAASPSTVAAETPSKHDAIAAAVPPASTGDSIKKMRKPVREKTAEEKAELARKAREARERKKLEKKALDDAILLRALANPAIDTTGIKIPDSISVTPALVASSQPAPVTQMTTPDPYMAYDPNVFGSASKESTPHPRLDTAMPDLKSIESPSGRSMNLGALID